MATNVAVEFVAGDEVERRIVGTTTIDDVLATIRRDVIETTRKEPINHVTAALQNDVIVTRDAMARRDVRAAEPTLDDVGVGSDIKRFEEIPGPRGLPFIGNALKYSQFGNKYGPSILTFNPET